MRNIISRLLLTTFLTSLLPSQATSVIDEGTKGFFTTLSEHIKKKLELDNLKPAEVGKIQVSFDKNTDLIKSIKQLNSGISAQAEANGIDAIITETPVNTNIQERNLLEEYSYGDFKMPDAQVERHKGIIKLHRIPLAVLYRYPNLFTSTELLADKNTLAVKLHGPLTKQILEIRAPWIAFFRANSSATREQILHLANAK